MIYLGFYLFTFVLGLVFGSFINSWIWRTRENIKMQGRSICINCRRQLKWWENIPVASFLYLKGKCRTCHHLIPWRYLAVEIISGLLFLFLGWYRVKYFVFDPWVYVGDAVFLTVLIIIFVYDWLYKIIPSSVVWFGAVFGLLFNYFYLGINISNLLWAALVAGGFFLVQYVVSRGRWIGGGDVRLGVMMGFWLGIPSVLVALFAGYVLGAVFGIIMLLRKRGSMKSEIPFGTFLALGTLLALYNGTAIVNWYLNLIKF